MAQTAGDSPKTQVGSEELKISIQDLVQYLEDWNLDSHLQLHTSQGQRSRKQRIEKFFWFLQYRGIVEVGKTEIKEFFRYCNEGHLEPGGRWGNPRMTTPMRATSVCGYHRILKAFFNYLVYEELIPSNPMKRIKPPAARLEIKHPVEEEQVQALIRAAKRSPYCRRDTAMLLLLVDTGLRASELCGLKVEDVDFETHSFKILGKGNKFRTCYMGHSSVKAVVAYLRGKQRQPDAPVFLSHTHKAFTASGVYQMLARLSRYAGITNPGVHALRRTFAVNMLKAGANVFTVQTLLGHSDLTMTRRYCRVAEADCAEQHRKYSPADRLFANSR